VYGVVEGCSPWLRPQPAETVADIVDRSDDAAVEVLSARNKQQEEEDEEDNDSSSYPEAVCNSMVHFLLPLYRSRRAVTNSDTVESYSR
jgi:hypothetical protein